MSNSIAVACEIYWGFFDRKNDMSGKYQVDLCNLSPKAVAALEELGLKVRNKGDEKGDFITVKSNNPIHLNFKPDVDPVDPDMVGNGTKANVSLSYYDWNFNGKKGRSPSLKKLLVTELNVFEGKGGESFDFDEIL